MNLLEMSRDQLVAYAAELQSELAESKKIETRLTQTEEELRQTKDRLELALKGADLGIWDWNMGTGKQVFNERWAEMLGYSLDEIEPDVLSWEKIVHPDDLQAAYERFGKHLEGTETSYEMEQRLRTKSGEWKWILSRAKITERDEDGRPFRVTGTHLDITDRKKAEEGFKKSEAELRASHEQFKAFMDNGPIIAFMRDDHSRYVYANQVFLKNNKFSEADVLGKTAKEIWPEEMAHKVTKEDRKVIESNRTVATVETLVDHTEYQRDWLLSRFPVTDADGRKYVGGVGLDLTESIRAQKALEASEARFRQIYECVPIMIHSADKEGVIRNVNRRWLSHMGYDREEVVGHSLDDFISRDPDVEPALVRSQLWAQGTASNVQRRYIKKDGSIIDTVLDSIIIDDPVLGKVSLTAVNDITALKQAEDQIKKSLEEKEVLLREINHRVKNNLQVISSLVRLQARQITAENASEALQETQNRLQTIGVIHEMLYQSRNLAYIDVEAYLKRLIANLFSLYGVKSSRTETVIYAQELRLGLDKADPLGLIVNELVSNCLKHAFPGDRKGVIRISLALEANEFEFVVSDNGTGLREDFEPFDAQTLGLVLVNTLVKQLHGVMTVERTAGTKFLIRFPVSTS